MSNANALFLLADHVKLSLLERQRAQSLNLDSDAQDGHLSRSLEQFKDGLDALQREQARQAEIGNPDKAAQMADAIPELQKQYDDLTAQFHGFASPSAADTLISPNDPTLASNFAHAVSTTTTTSSSSSASPPGNKKMQQQQSLFQYRDDPDAPQGYRDQAGDLTNQQVQAYHAQILSEQDAQLDALGASISRQRELSMQIGDELDSQVLMLDESERIVDRHQGRLDRARRQVGRFARSAGESKQMMVIVILIVILVLLIIILK
ncbi:hypothetical protein P8C59_004400 [Phyllachora maydis]|uniref:t-SNARE coiled-coil homology domain-containing protein n=1 Tax=Phyllachora maydis TaxID=1825666 RepID=A0AAD9MAC9_9PEZI|nr:hypothetical protein P8C59_004400 [Phyllachora maydis]